MQRRTLVVDGPLAFRMRRAGAAKAGEFDLEILTLPQMAARLAGGFVRAASNPDIDTALNSVLGTASLGDLTTIANLPGIVRAMRVTLLRLWRAPAGAITFAANKRLTALADVDRRVRETLPAGMLSPPDLADAALGRVVHGRAVFGEIELSGLTDIAPVWRRLLSTLATHTSIVWRNPGSADATWFAGDVVRDPFPAQAVPLVESSADPRAEAVEALRWLRELIASGRAAPQDIAITAPSTELWDEHFLSSAGEADLPLHFSHGVPVLSTPAGQLCAALADILLNGLSQDRVRRVTGYAALARGPLRELPGTWSLGLASAAGLFELAHWQDALDAATARANAGPDPRPVLMPLLELLGRGPQAAADAGDLILGAAAREIWREALRRAPADAIEYTLQSLRAPDGRDPASSVVWAPASHVVGAPRPWLRCLGLNTRSWPRHTAEDPLLPTRFLTRDRLAERGTSEDDRHALALLLERAHGGVVLSRARRNAQGGRLSISPLLPLDVQEIALARTRTPPHAFSRADRLLARPQEARALAHIAGPTRCWRSWRFDNTAGENDGLMRADHPLLQRALEQAHSATSLRQLLRDPLSFVWRYALGWRAPAQPETPLELDFRAFGELVHAVLRRSVQALEPDPGYMLATEAEIEAAVKSAVIAVADQWRLERSTPPRLLWLNTLHRARADALAVLKFNRAERPGVKSFAEVRFGDVDAGDAQQPWAGTAEAAILRGEAALRGVIDRLDVTDDHDAIVTDYKTGRRPDNLGVIAGGADLQRAVYTAAVRAILPETRHVSARLIYLTDGRVKVEELDDADAAVAALERCVDAARAALGRGAALPGPDAAEDWNEYRLALPATLQTYLQRKQADFRQKFGAFVQVWAEP
jgi:RecB family exonuclease